MCIINTYISLLLCDLHRINFQVIVKHETLFTLIFRAKGVLAQKVLGHSFVKQVEQLLQDLANSVSGGKIKLPTLKQVLGVPSSANLFNLVGKFNASKLKYPVFPYFAFITFDLIYKCTRKLGKIFASDFTSTAISVKLLHYCACQRCTTTSLKAGGIEKRV